jgi:hypothetical protein
MPCVFAEKGLDEMNLDELNENEDDIDEEEERLFEQYRYMLCVYHTLHLNVEK